MSSFKDVIAKNAELLKKAQDLNKRAGETIFLHTSREFISSFLETRLQGARSMKDIADFRALSLPGLNTEKVAEVLRNFPDTIQVNGHEWLIEYKSGYEPRIKLDRIQIDAGEWRHLPDEGVKLPNGRLLEVCFTWDYWTSFTEKDVPKLKQRLVKEINSDQWAKFKKPEIAMPDPADSDSRVQCVITEQYGKCVVTGEPLLCYGTVKVRHNRWRSDDSHFEMEWILDQGVANSLHEEAIAYLDRIRVEEREKIESEARYNTALEVHNQARELYYASSCVDEELRSRFYEMIFRENWDKENALVWQEKVTMLMQEVQAAVDAEKTRREAERKAKELAEARDLEVYGMTGYLLEIARYLVKQGVKMYGHQRAAQIFETELTAPYGRARRQDAIGDRLGDEDSISSFYHLSKAREVDAVLEAAIKLVNELSAEKAEKQKQATKPQTPADPNKFDMGQLFGGRAKVGNNRKGR